jgi:small subunit ribosomal protein S20
MVKTQIKHFEDALTEGNLEKAGEQLKMLTRRLDRISATSTMHKNTAARIKSRMTRRLNKAKAQKA